MAIPSSPTSLIVAFMFLLSCAHCSSHKEPTDSFRGMVSPEKMRLGSTPPSCHNKCNECHPCTAVQVPTLPTHGGRVDYYSSSAANGNRYSNYKPLGWKCMCGTQFYNP